MQKKSSIESACLNDTIGMINDLMSIGFANYTRTRLVVSTHKLDARYYDFYQSRRTASSRKASHVIAPQSGIYPEDALKLYFIYALYKGNFEFADSISLKTSGGAALRYNPGFDLEMDSAATEKQRERMMKSAFINYRLLKQAEKSYQKWLIELNKVGMAEMRRRNIHPLYWSDLTW